MMYDLRCNNGGARPIKVIFWDKAQGLEQSTSQKCPETSGLPGSVLTFTPPGLLRNPMIKLI